MPTVSTAALRTSHKSSGNLARFRKALRSDPSGSSCYIALLGLPVDAPPTINNVPHPSFLRVSDRVALRKAQSRSSAIVALVQYGVPFGLLEGFQRTVGLSVEQIAALVQIPTRTLTRRRESGHLRPDESDRLFRAARVFGRVLALYDGKLDEAREWLASPQRGLGGAVPLTLAATDHGAQTISDIIGRMEYGLGA